MARGVVECLAARRDVVEVLHLSGAKDRYIAGLFQRRFAFLAARAGGYGALAAIVLAGLLRGLGGTDGFTPVLPLAWSDLVAAVRTGGRAVRPLAGDGKSPL